MKHNNIIQYKKQGGISHCWMIVAAMLMHCVCLIDGFSAITTTTITSNTTVTYSSNASTAISGTVVYNIQNGSTMTLQGSGSITAAGRILNLPANTKLIIGPDGGNPNSMVIFESGTTSGQGGAISMANGSWLEITNGIFRNNRNGYTENNGVGGALNAGPSGNNTYVKLTNVRFENNVGRGNSGVMRITGTLIMSGGGFYGNVATGDFGGALGHRGVALVTLNDVVFDENRARTHSGAISAEGTGTITLNNTIFTDNWVGTGQGGAIRSSMSTGYLLFSMTAAGGINSFVYSGNFAGGPAAAPVGPSPSDEQVLNNNPDFDAAASAGGFYYATGAGLTEFNIDSGVTLSIGKASETNKAYDSIASAATGIANLKKSGDGDLILNADNSYYTGAFTVDAGRLIMGNEGAQLGGRIEIGAGAALVGTGTLATRLFTGTGTPDADGIVSVTAKAGSLIQVGLDGATSAQSLVFARTGTNTLTLEAGSHVTFDLFGSTGDEGTYDRIIADGVTVDSGTITVSKLGSASSYTLISASSLSGTVASMELVITSTQASGPRSIISSHLAKSGEDLILANVLSNMALTWTGSTSGQWTAANWADVLGAPTETRVATGDSITFDSTSDDPARRSITIGAGGVTVSGMKITGDADYTFNFMGAGGITVDAASVHGTITGANGILEKSGTGTLTFTGNGANSFGGLLFNNGRIVVDKASNLGKLGALTFNGGLSTALRIEIKDDAAFVGGGAASDDYRLNLASMTAGTAKNSGFWVAGGKKFSIENNNSLSNGGALFVGDYNNFEIVSLDSNPIEVLFQSNTTAANGGALYVGANSSVRLDNAVFTDNAAAGTGGAIHNSGSLTITLAGDATYSGNTAATAGFLFQNGAAASTTLDIAADKTLVIGADTDATKDGIASADASSLLTKKGLGTIVLNGNGSGFTGTTNIAEGRLLLGNNAASLGGIVNVGAGRVVGGIGSFANITGVAGSLIQVGLDNALSSGTINVTGQLSLSDGTINMDLFANNSGDRVNVGTFVGSGNNINITRFQSGTFNLGDNLGGLAASGTLKIGGYVAIAGSRQFGTLSDVGGNLQLIAQAGDNLALVWTGSTSGNWNPIDANWAGVGDGLFAGGDTVTFDDTADVFSVTSAEPVTVSDMIVNTSTLYTFNGGGITSDASSVLGATITNAAGKLLKQGTGTLALHNNASENNFKGGVDLEAGLIELGAGLMVRTGTFAVKGANTALRAAGDAALVSSVFDMDAYAFAIDTQAHALSISGTIKGSAGFAKAGSGTLTLNDASTYGGTTSMTEGTLVLGNSAALGVSTLAIDGDGTVVAFGSGGFTVANDIALNNALTLDAANSGTLSGAISGTGNFTKIGAGVLGLHGASTMSGTLAINEGIVSLNSASALGAAKLGGSGTLAIAATGNFAFAPTATGGGFTGGITVNSGNFILDNNAAAILAPASTSLYAGIGASVTKAAGDITISTLTLNNSQLNLSMNGLVPDGLLSVTTLNIGTGTNKIGVDASFLGNQPNPAVPPAPNLLDQDGVTSVRLIASTTIIGNAALKLSDTNGAALATPTIVDITQGANTVAKASYNYTTTVVNSTTASVNGVYMGYGLSEIEVLEGQNLTLDSTSATDSTLSAKITGTGGIGISGAVTLSNAGNTYTGTTTINAGGTLKGGAANVIARSTAVDVQAGATLDLGGYAQTAQNLTGAGLVNMGTVALTLQNTADSTFDGNLNGTAKVIKTGTGKLSLTGSNNFAGLDLAAGAAVGLGNAHASGTGAVTVTGTGAKIAVELNNFTLANTISMGAHGLIIDSAANNTTITSAISGAGALTLQGTGTTTLDGTSTFTGGLKVNTARVIAPRTNVLGTGVVTMNAASTLEFRNIASGTVANRLTGGGVDLNNSTLTFTGTNALLRLNIGGGSKLTARSVSALGGGNSAVNVAGNGVLVFDVPETIAKSVNVETGGQLLFNSPGGDPMLKTSGTVTFANSSTITLGTLSSGNKALVQAAGGIVNNGVVLDPGANVEILTWTVDGSNVAVHVLQRDVNPGKQIAAAYDAITAATGAVYNRLSESFLMSSLTAQPDDPNNSFWFKGVGSFADYDGSAGKVGYTSDTYGAMVGYDRKISENLLVGGYVGYLSNSIKTSRSDTDSTLPYGGLYGAIRQGSVYLSGDIMYGAVDADTTRDEYFGYANGSYKATALAGSIELGTVLGTWERGAIKPSAALHYMSVSYTDHEETGVGSVFIDDIDDNRLETLLSLLITQGFDMPWNQPAAFDLRLGWRAALRDSPLNVIGHFTEGGETFTIEGDRYKRNGLMLGFGLRFGITRMSSFGLAYDYELGREYGRHNINATIRFNW